MVCCKWTKMQDFSAQCRFALCRFTKIKTAYFLTKWVEDVLLLRSNDGSFSLRNWKWAHRGKTLTVNFVENLSFKQQRRRRWHKLFKERRAIHVRSAPRVYASTHMVYGRTYTIPKNGNCVRVTNDTHSIFIQFHRSLFVWLNL